MAVHEVAATLVREPLDARPAAHEALRALRGDDRPFALIGAWAGGGAVLGSEPVRLAQAGGRVVDQPGLLPGPADRPDAAGVGPGGHVPPLPARPPRPGRRRPGRAARLEVPARGEPRH